MKWLFILSSEVSALETGQSVDKKREGKRSCVLFAQEMFSGRKLDYISKRGVFKLYLNRHGCRTCNVYPARCFHSTKKGTKKEEFFEHIKGQQNIKQTSNCRKHIAFEASSCPEMFKRTQKMVLSALFKEQCLGKRRWLICLSRNFLTVICNSALLLSYYKCRVWKLTTVCVW